MSPLNETPWSRTALEARHAVLIAFASGNLFYSSGDAVTGATAKFWRRVGGSDDQPTVVLICEAGKAQLSVEYDVGGTAGNGPAGRVIALRIIDPRYAP